VLSLNEAVDRVLIGHKSLPIERLPLALSYGRVLAEDVISPRSIPPWDNSAMDGYAVRSVDVTTQPVVLKVLEVIPAGTMPTRSVTQGACSKIMTGAPMPEGADSVIIVEDAKVLADGMVELSEVSFAGKNVREKGNDVALGSTVLAVGHFLDAAAVGMLSSLGIAAVSVYQRPLVAILSTGDEVIEVGNPLEEGQIYSSNNHTLAGLVAEAGGEAMDCGIAPDDPEGLRDCLARCLRADLILTTGGVSMGDFDFVKEALEAHGSELDFWKVAIKPGKPLAYGKIGGKPAFGLPGNPVSCMVNFHEFVRPVLRRMMGDERGFLPVIEALLDVGIKKRPGRALFARLTLRQAGDGTIIASPLINQSSGALTSMVVADGLGYLEASAGSASVGDVVSVQVLNWRWMDRTSTGLKD
jgi:molybdopterin molybdotransferase